MWMQIWTPLHHAVHTNQQDTVNLLLPHGVDPDGVGRVGQAVCHVQCLLSFGSCVLEVAVCNEYASH